MVFNKKFISGKREDSIRAGGDPESIDRSRVQQTPGENRETEAAAVCHITSHASV